MGLEALGRGGTGSTRGIKHGSLINEFAYTVYCVIIDTKYNG